MMLTTDHNRETLRQARAEMRQAGRQHIATSADAWRLDALERAGELALEGLWSESRKAAQEAR